MSVTIAVGDNWQTVTTAQPAGTTFDVAAGTHTSANASVPTPKAGNIYAGPAVTPPVAIMDGNNTATVAIGHGAGKINGVQVRNLEVRKYNPASAMIVGSGDPTSSWSTDWIVDNVYAHDSLKEGVRLGTRGIFSNSRSYNNKTLGFVGCGDDLLVNNVALDDNGDPAFVLESGATKCVLTNRLQILNSTASRNLGPAWWLDIANDNYLISGCTATDNYSEGFVVEISYGGRITNCKAFRSGLRSSRSTAWFWNAGFSAQAAGGTGGLEIDHCYAEGCAYGVTLIQQLRGKNNVDSGVAGVREDGTGVAAEMYTQNVNVHDCVTVLKNYNAIPTAGGNSTLNSQSAAGVVDDTGLNQIYFNRNNHFTNNKYFVRSTDTGPFGFNNGGFRTFAYWQATALHDATGTYVRQIGHYRPGDK